MTGYCNPFDAHGRMCERLPGVGSTVGESLPVRERPRTVASGVCCRVSLFLGVVAMLATGRTSAEQKAEPAAEVYNFEQHVKPIFQAHCIGCHDAERQRGGLALDSFAGVMAGGASGEVVIAGETGGSRLWHLVNHEDQPTMPPDSEKLPEAKLAVIRQWIETGALERSGQVPLAKEKTAWSVETIELAEGQMGPMPEGLVRQPVSYSPSKQSVAAVACSPNAPLVAITSTHQVVLYHAQTRDLLGILPFPSGTPQAIRFSRNGQLLLVAGGRGAHSGWVSIFDVASGDRLIQLGDADDSRWAVDIDPVLERVATGGPSKRVQVYSATSGEELFVLDKHTDWVRALSYSPDGKWLATGDRNGGIWLWEAMTGREVQALNAHDQSITALSWRPDATVLASSSEDGQVRLWEVASGKPIRNWIAHAGGCSSVSFSRTGQLVTTGRDRQVKLWDASGKHLRDFDDLADIGLTADVTYDGQHVVAGDWNGHVRVWQTDSGAPRGELDPQPPTLDQRLAQLDVRVADAARQLNQSQAELATARSQLAGVQQEHDAALAAVAQITNESSTAEGAVSSDVAAEQLANAERTLGQKSAELANANRRVAHLEQSQLEFEVSHQQTLAQREQVADQLAGFQQRPAWFAVAVAERQARLDQLGANLAEQRRLANALLESAEVAGRVARLVAGSPVATKELQQQTRLRNEQATATEEAQRALVREAERGVERATAELERSRQNQALFQSSYQSVPESSTH